VSYLLIIKFCRTIWPLLCLSRWAGRACKIGKTHAASPRPKLLGGHIGASQLSDPGERRIDDQLELRDRGLGQNSSGE